MVQYADDTILVMPACPVQATRMKSILEDYAASVGLKINFHKSTLILTNLSAESAFAFARLFGSSVGSMPFTYLGLPLSVRRVHSSHLLPLVDRIRKKLSTWSASLLARGERLALVRHVLCALSGHMLATIVLNAHVL